MILAGSGICGGRWIESHADERRFTVCGGISDRESPGQEQRTGHDGNLHRGIARNSHQHVGRGDFIGEAIFLRLGLERHWREEDVALVAALHFRHESDDSDALAVE